MQHQFNSIREGLLSEWGKPNYSHCRSEECQQGDTGQESDTKSGDKGPGEDLVEENAKLRKRIKEWKQLVDQLKDKQTISVPTLVKEISSLLPPRNCINHGLDTSVHFDQFSLEALQVEHEKYDPSALKLQQVIGNVDRHESQFDIYQAQARISMVMYSLVKFHSAKVQAAEHNDFDCQVNKPLGMQQNLHKWNIGA